MKVLYSLNSFSPFRSLRNSLRKSLNALGELATQAVGRYIETRIVLSSLIITVIDSKLSSDDYHAKLSQWRSTEMS